MPITLMELSKMNSKNTPIAWMALRDGMAPIYGLSPSEIKMAGYGLRPYKKFRNVARQNAICRQLGFDVGFTGYKNQCWPEIQQLFEEHGLRYCVDLLSPTSHLEYIFAPGKRHRRSLADRLFFGTQNMPTHVFTGFGYDDEWWEAQHRVPLSEKKLFLEEYGLSYDTDPIDLTESRLWIFHALAGYSGALDFCCNPYFQPTMPEDLSCIPVFFFNDEDADRCQLVRERCARVARVLHTILLSSEQGWLKVIELSSNLIALKAPSGEYDLLWRNLRNDYQPAFDIAEEADALPVSVLEGRYILQERFRELDVWEDKDSHAAETRYYATEAIRGARYPGSDVLLERYLRENGRADHAVTLSHQQVSRRRVEETGFSEVEKQRFLHALQLSSSHATESCEVSSLINKQMYEDFLKSNAPRTPDVAEAFVQANDLDDLTSPVGISYMGALAFCAYAESMLGVNVRLLTEEEHRMLRPSLEYFFVESQGESFNEELWREALKATACLWSVDDETQSSNAVRAKWQFPVVYTEHCGIQFMDASDAPEWCERGTAVSLTRTEHFGVALNTWGEYKQKKITFRLVIDNSSSDR